MVVMGNEEKTNNRKENTLAFLRSRECERIFSPIPHFRISYVIVFIRCYSRYPVLGECEQNAFVDSER